MARARSIKPGFFKNADLAECGLGGQLLFAGLWCLADRAGRLIDDPRWIKGELFAHHPKLVVNLLLTLLERRNFILRYQVDGKRYIQIVAFHKHQNPHIREPDSKIPAPGQPSASPVLAQFQPSASTGPAPLTPDSFNLTPLLGLKQPAPRNTSRPPCVSETPALLNQNGASRPDFLEWFERIYREHPKKGQKQVAQQYLARLYGTLDLDDFAAKHTAWSKHPQWTGEAGRFGPTLAAVVLDQFWLYDPPAADTEPRTAAGRAMAEAMKEPSDEKR